MLNIYNPNIDNYRKSALNAIEDGWISNHGRYVELANSKLKDVTKSKYSILMANGTCATHCLFLSLKFKHPNINKIYIPNNCYVAAWNSVLMEYNIVSLTLMKMDNNTWNICTDDDYIKMLDTNAAVLIVHNLGNIINVPRLKRLRPDLIFIEDNCEGMFGKYEDSFSGMSEASLCSSCSFYGNKIVTTGEGGAFFTQYEDVYLYIKSVYSQGMSNTRYLHILHAYNYRMTNVQAGFLYDQLNDIENILENKYKIFQSYDHLLNGLVKLGKIQLIKHSENTTYAPWLYALRIVNNTKTVEETTEFFRSNNVDIRPFFYPINAHEHLSTMTNVDEVSYLLNKEVIMIPSSPTISIEEQTKVVDVIYKLIFGLTDIEIRTVNMENQEEIYSSFLSNIDNVNFRYFNNRSIACLNNHILTVVLYDTTRKLYIGYTHIDYVDKYWLGIYIDDYYRGKKLGTMLLQYLLQHKPVCKLNSIHLTVDLNNEIAIKLYKQNSFNIIKTTDKYYEMERLKHL
jgi:perosamine synthetase